MARVNIPAQDGSAASFPWSTAGLTLTWTAADASNKQSTAACGRLLILARNSGATPRLVTITSVADPKTGRTGDASSTVAAGATWAHVINREGWEQSGNVFHYEAAHAEILFAVVKLDP